LFLKNNHIYRESGVMTDMRLLFNDELENPPKCGVILHIPDEAVDESLAV
jgi:hypothetical protein